MAAHKKISGGVTVLLVAGGRGARLGLDLPKPLVPLNRRAMVCYSLRTFERSADIDHLILVCGAEWQEQALALTQRWAPKKTLAVVPGGQERADSVYAGLARLPEDCRIIAIHDAARPFVTPQLITLGLAALAQHHGSVPGLPVADTLRKQGEAISLGAADRTRYVLTQTPQCFQREILELAFQRARADQFTGTDDAAYVERLPGARIAIVPGDPANFKITTREDLERARRMVDKRRKKTQRCGEGYDAHRLVPGRPLILGGVTIPHEKGLLGHSDADVLCHALGDALLGAAAQGDLGVHFPDSDPAYKGISSLVLLKKIAQILRERGFEIVNVDATLVLESPKIAPYRQQMIANLAQALQIEAACVSVKGTTTEGMGFEGRGEGVSCRAVAIVEG